MDNKFNIKPFIIVTFVSLYLLVSVISTIHSIQFFKLSNPSEAMALTLAIAFEIGAAASLASIIVLDKMNRLLIWSLFIVLTAIQSMSNAYYAYINLNDFVGWIELFGIKTETLIYQKRILSLVSGAILPLISLGFIKSLVDYIRPHNEFDEEEGYDNEEEEEEENYQEESNSGITGKSEDNDKEHKEETSEDNPDNNIVQLINTDNNESANDIIRNISLPTIAIALSRPKRVINRTKKLNGNSQNLSNSTTSKNGGSVLLNKYKELIQTSQDKYGDKLSEEEKTKLLKRIEQNIIRR